MCRARRLLNVAAAGVAPDATGPRQIQVARRAGVATGRGAMEWRRPDREALLNLYHPIDAGAYRWGRREVDPRKKVPGKPSTGRTFKAYDQYRVLIRDRFPADIDWEEFERNQHKLRDHSALGKLLAAPRHGPSVLAGLPVCGRCGHRMVVGYMNAATRKTLRCRCQREAIAVRSRTSAAAIRGS